MAYTTSSVILKVKPNRGEKTAGHATVQTFMHLDANLAIKITTAKLMRPSGAQLNLAGVRPDHVLKSALDPEAQIGSSQDEVLTEALRIIGARGSDRGS